MKYLILLFTGVLLVGCDQFPGPNVRSEFSMPVKLTIAYSDGKNFSHEWSPCQVFGLGAMDTGKLGVKPKEGVFIKSIVIEAEGRVIHHFDKTIIGSLIDKQKKEGGYPIWVIDESGIHFSTDGECFLDEIPWTERG